MLIDIIEFYATETIWTLEADINARPVTVCGGFYEGFADFDGVDFQGLPIGRTSLAVDFLIERLDGQHLEGRPYPLGVNQQDRDDAQNQFFWDF